MKFNIVVADFDRDIHIHRTMDNVPRNFWETKQVVFSFYFNASLANLLLLELAYLVVVALASAPSHTPMIISGETGTSNTTPIHQRRI